MRLGAFGAVDLLSKVAGEDTPLGVLPLLPQTCSLQPVT